MKVAITGHTKGIGKAIADLYPDHIGFSRSNGYDISDELVHKKIITESSGSDIFINNAYFLDAQSKLFSMMFEVWREDESKTIVNIISRARYDTHFEREYSNNKRDLGSVANPGFMYGRNCRIINISPGWVATERVPEDWLISNDHPYITAAKCAKYVKWAIDQDLEIGELSFWRSK